jgi:hypothetical protein
MNTLATTTAPSADSDSTGWLDAARRAIAPWRRRATQQTLPEGAAELLARAAAYETTQPSFAADLRAGAQRMIDGR